MIKTGIVIFACFCIATVLTEAVGLGVLWSRGQLTERTFREIEVILTGADLLQVDLVEEEQTPTTPSLDVVEEKRLMKLLEIDKRESLVDQRYSDLEKFRDELTETQEQLIRDRETFHAELKKIQEENQAEATELARGVLLASSPKDAAARLMDLTLEQNVILLRGLPEENIAKILKELHAGQDQERSMRATQIYKSIYSGEPIESTVMDQLQPQTAAASP